MVDFLGTDMHHDRHMMMLKSLAGKQDFYDIVANAELLNKTLL